MSKLRSSKSNTSGHTPMFGEAEVALLDLLKPFIECADLITHEVIDRCEKRGLLPIGLMDEFLTVLFVSCTVLSAQKAQRLYGVPASVLMSIALLEEGFDAGSLAGDQPLIQCCGCCVPPNLDKWFLEKAQHLATFREAMPLVDDVKRYIEKLRDLGFCEGLEAEDLIANIENYHLEECDVAAILLPGQYDSTLFKVVRDDAGRAQLKPGMDLREWRETMERLRKDSPQPTVA